jgi:peptide/nickel transport system substrate-binding protein
LVYARQFETLTLDPIDIRNGNGDIFAVGLIYQGLVQYDPSGNSDIVPGIAESWTVSDDATTYTFKLNPNAKFSNGDPVTAEDVKFSLDRFGNPDINQVMGLMAKGYGSATILDPSTVEVTLTEPIPAFLDNIAIFPALVVPKRLVEAQGAEFWKKPVGSGPFQVDSFTSGESLVLSRNPHYWEEGKPYLDSVTFNFATDANARMLSLISGQAQIADGITPSKISEVNSNENLVLQSHEWPAWFSIFMSQEVPALADPNVRLAIAHAINREEINEQIFGGLGTVPNSLFAALRYDAGPETVKPIEFSVDKAKELMAASGYPEGFSVKLEYPSGIDYYNQLTLALQQYLSEIGVELELVKVDPATMSANVSADDFEMTFGYPQVSSDVAVPDEYATFYGIPSANNGFHTGWKDPEVEKLVQTFITTPDDASRAEQWPVIQQALMDAQPALNLLNFPLLNAHALDVCNAQTNAMGVDMLQETWLAPSNGG